MAFVTSTLILSFLLAGISSTGAVPLHARQETLSTCLHAANITIMTEEDSGFADEISPFNLRLPYVPALVAIPTTKEQVATAVKCAAAAEIKVQPRGGGHSYGAMGLGGKDGSFMIDMKRFQTIQVNNDTKIATVGPGVRLGNLILGLDAQGKRAIPHGICPGVGIAGHALHGGFGFTSRLWGIALDVITELEVVLANGTITRASKLRNPDLFWALRGAGSSFGIVTEFNFQTQPQPETGISFSAALAGGGSGFGAGSMTIAKQVDAFMAFQNYSLVAPKEVALRVAVNLGRLQITGVYWGTLAAAKEALAPLGTMLNATLSYTSRAYTNTLSSINGAGGGFKQPVDGYNQHETFYAKSLVVKEKDGISRAGIESFLTYLSKNASSSNTNWWALADLYGGGDSQINAHSLDETSYAHRDGLFTWQLYANSRTFRPPYPNSGISFVQGMADAFTDAQPETKFMAYANYNDPLLTAAEAHELYYDGQYEKLLRIKKEVDPDNLFWNPQAIGA